MPTRLEAHTHTSSRYLEGKGYRKWIAKKRPKLIAVHTVAPLRWVVKRDWTEEQWGNYIQSDGCSVESGSFRAVFKWVFRHEVKTQTWLD